MAASEMKQKIKDIAIEHFSRDGFHGATIRNIALEAACSLPMVNYYYKSKQELFCEIICEDYYALLCHQVERLSSHYSLLQYYTEFVYGLNALEERERKIYRLGVKVYLGFDGEDSLRQAMQSRRQSILPYHPALAQPENHAQVQSVYVARALLRVVANMVEEIIVRGVHLSRREIREELSAILCKPELA